MIRTLTVTLLFSVAIIAQANAAQVVRAGDWETTIDGGPARHTCMGTDRTFDQASMAKTLALTGQKCASVNWHQAGNVTTFESVCNVAGGKLTTRSVITVTGPDSFTTHSSGHMVGGTVKMSDKDLDMTQTARRDGPCTPGEKPSRY
jgi:opacity protein-like surface antigen